MKTATTVNLRLIRQLQLKGVVENNCNGNQQNTKHPSEGEPQTENLRYSYGIIMIRLEYILSTQTQYYYMVGMTKSILIHC